MLTLEGAPAIRAMRVALATREAVALRALAPWLKLGERGLPPDIEHALLEHTFFACRRAVESSDDRLAEQALATWSVPRAEIESRILDYHGKQWLNLDSRYCLSDPRLDKGFDSHVYVVSPAALRQEGRLEDRAFFAACWQLLEEAGMFSLVENATAILVNLKYRTMDDSLSGYSVNVLRGTVYSDWTDSALRHAESIVHEAAHTWLNWTLEANGGQSVDSAARFWSPWRHQMRPALGIVHGAWAFSIVWLFYEQLARHRGYGLIDARQLAYCVQRARYERTRLSEVRAFLPTCLALIDCEVVSALVGRHFPHAEVL